MCGPAFIVAFLVCGIGAWFLGAYVGQVVSDRARKAGRSPEQIEQASRRASGIAIVAAVAVALAPFLFPPLNACAF